MMCQGELPDYFKQYALNRNITMGLNKADEEVIKSASTKLDYLAFSYYRSSVQASFDEIDDVITLEDAILFDQRNLKNPYYQAK